MLFRFFRTRTGALPNSFSSFNASQSKVGYERYNILMRMGMIQNERNKNGKNRKRTLDTVL